MWVDENGERAKGPSRYISAVPFIHNADSLGYNPDDTGRPIDSWAELYSSDFKGKVVVMFFGYTQCPDVCPTTMVEMSNVMKELGPDADRVQVLFVTVDPERDTQEVLAQYVPAFDKRFLGLRGDLQQTEKVAKEFKVFYQKVPGKQPGSYTMDHTAGSYVFDPQGHIRLFVKHGQGPQTLAHDIKLLLS